MKKERKSIELDDLFEEEASATSNDRDMIVVNTRAQKPKTEKPSGGGRESRLQSAQITTEGEVYGYDEPVYEDVDLGEIKVKGGEIHRQRQEQEKKAFEQNQKEMTPIIQNLEGEEAEDVLEFDEDVETAEERIERQKIEATHKETVDRILEDLLT